MLSDGLKIKLSAIRTEHKQIASGMFVVGFFVLIGKFAGAAKEMVVAWRYGVSETVDAYLFVFNLAQWPATIVGGVLGAVLVPLAARMRNDAPSSLPVFRSELLGATLALSIGLGVAAWQILPWLVQQPWLGLNGGQLTVARQMSSHLAWVLPLSILAHLFSAWTMAANRHLNTLLEGVPALMIMVSVFYWSGVSPLVWGTLLGFLVQVVFLCVALARRNEVEAPRILFRSPHWRFFFAGFGLMLVGQAMMSVVSLLDQFFAARLGPGALSSLGYSSRILSLILGLGAMAISRAILPVLSQSYAKDASGMLGIVTRWAGMLFGVGLLMFFVAHWLAPWGVEILFQRGQFTAEDTNRVTEVLKYSLVQIPFYFCSMVLVYALLSQRKYKEIVLISAGNLLVKIALAALLVPTMGLNGLVLSTAGVYFGSVLLSMWVLWVISVKKIN